MATLGIIIGAMAFGILVFIIGMGFGKAIEQEKIREQKKEEELHNEMTMHKVYRAMMDNGIPQRQAVDAVDSMRNVGILFREREHEDLQPYLPGLP